MKAEIKCRHCADCNKVIIPDDGVEVDTEVVEHGQHIQETITVCQGCYRQLYQNDYMSELYFYEFGTLDTMDKPIQL